MDATSSPTPWQQPNGPQGGPLPLGPQSPSINLPKGGGAIRGIGEKFAANPTIGTGSMTVPIACSPGRAGFGPQLALTYDSGAGNGVFGLGWRLQLPGITRKTDQGLPCYNDADEADVFVLSGAEDLVPVLERENGNWRRQLLPTRSVGGIGYRIQRYLPRIEASFARIERWTNPTDATDVFWRSISPDNITTWYGRTDESRICDPAHPERIFSWLICATYDDKGNAISYGYKRENDRHVDRTRASEHNREVAANRYLKRIRYGNHDPYLPTLREHEPWPPLPGDDKWFFELVFDYGDHDDDAPVALDTPEWPVRPDPSSAYRSGFEIRTYRRCRRTLMFHHFADDPDVGADCLVRSTDFDYVPTDTTDRSSLSKLVGVTQRGYQRSGPGYRSRSLPPMAFAYTEAVVASEVRELSAASLENLPAGLDNVAYRWVDLDGDGLPGVLAEQGSAWFYKPNLSPVNVLSHNGETHVEAAFGPAQLMTQKPAVTLASGAQFLDLAGDGKPDVVQFAAPAGFYERNADAGWESFVAFHDLPNRDMRDRNLRFIDLDGDGLADVLITETDALTWYPSLGERGFAPDRRVTPPLDEYGRPALVFADAEQSIHLADMSGDGLADLVRIRRCGVCYWPNLGYGRFGAMVNMDGPVGPDGSATHLSLDHAEQFDQHRIRLADIDGSGTTDLIYIGDEGVVVYFNQSGNGWAAPVTLPALPPGAAPVDIDVVDLLGNGTACLVWSSPLPGDVRRPLRYIDLMGDKPHLLNRISNNLGAETEIAYAPSTKFCLQDKLSGKPWATTLPFPVHVVERITLRDRWRNTTFTSSFSYHHGYFDGVEREFRGFGRIEQVDTEDYGTFAALNAHSPYITADQGLHQPPVKTVSWHHTGAPPDDGHLLDKYREEYFPRWATSQDKEIAGTFAECVARETQIDVDDLSADEERQAWRAFKGLPLRQEIFELDLADLARGVHKPTRLFAATAYSQCVRVIQPQKANRHASFHVFEVEALSYHYELDLRPQRLTPDPRTTHAINLTVDKYGHVLQGLTVGYPRSSPTRLNDALIDDAAETLAVRLQDQQHCTYVETRYTDDDIPAPPAAGTDLDNYRIRLPIEVKYYEINGITPQHAGDGSYLEPSALRHNFTLSDLHQAGGAIVTEIPYQQLPDGVTPQKRLVEHTRSLFFDDAMQGPAPLGKLTARALPFETYTLALTEDLLTGILDDKLTADVSNALRENSISGYLSGQRAVERLGADAADQYWSCSGTAGYTADAPQNFFLPERYSDAFGNLTTVEYDPTNLYVLSHVDPVENRTTTELFDFRVLAPRRIRDINGNHAEAVYDVLGAPTVTALSGKNGEGDSLAGVDDAVINPTTADLESFFVTNDYDEHRARQLLAGATSHTVYYFGEVTNPDGSLAWGQHPASTATIARELHASEDDDSVVQTAFSYLDGSGSLLLRKIQAEPEPQQPGLRWVANGKTVMNNKGSPVKQYEPYFASRESGHRFADPHEVGVTAVLYYDAIGRLIRTDLPDGSYTRSEFSPWHSTEFDANDTLGPDNPWQQRMSASPDVAERTAALRASAHAGTPTMSVLDSVGRAVLTIHHNRVGGVDSKDLTFHRLDAEGKPLWVVDARRNRVIQHITPALPPSAIPWDDPNNIWPQGVSPTYDIAGQPLYSHSMDSSERWTLPDATGNPLFSWDSRGYRRRNVYDRTRRPINVYLTASGLTTLAGSPRAAAPPDAEVLVQRHIYGEHHPDVQANLRGQLFSTYDGAGVSTNSSYDFKGNRLSIERHLARDYKSVPDWAALAGIDDPDAVAAAAAPQLEPGAEFVTRIGYDALNRPTTVTKPDGSVYHAQFNQANLLNRIDVTLDGAPAATPFVTNIDYNAKGQRLRVEYGNGVSTTYAYDDYTFRLTSARTERPAQPDATASMLFANAAVVQDLRYTYDPVGNVTRVVDDAVIATPQATGTTDYIYDARYRLVAASGREHSGQTGFLLEPNDAKRRDYPFAGSRIHPNDLLGLRGYIERFRYDAVGNLMALIHHAGTNIDAPGAVVWQRRYQYALDSNRLLATSLPADPDQPDYSNVGGYSLTYAYDAHGSIDSVAHLSHMAWNYQDELAATAQQVVNGGNPETTYYVYDSAGTRVRKVTETAAGARKNERVYLDGYEVYREYTGGNVVLERQTLHVMDGDRRVAIVETERTGGDQQPRMRYQIGNQLDSVTVELDVAGELIAYEEYHPYGTTAFQAGRSVAEVSLKRYRYTGKERDDETGFAYHGARYYLPWLGRWLSCDPIGVRGGLNLYCYADNRPTVAIDPNGHFAWLLVAAIVIVATLTAVSEAGAPANEREAQAVKPHITEGEFAAHTAVTGLSFAAGGAAGGALKGAPAALQGGVGGLVGGAAQSAGDQVIQDVKKGELSSGREYADTTFQGAAGGAAAGFALGAGAQLLGKGLSALKPGEGKISGPPQDPYDTKAWNKYYAENPNAKRSVGSAQADDPAAFGKGDGKPAPRFTPLPYIAPEGREITAQPTGKTPSTAHNAAALADRGRRITNAYPRDHEHHVLPQAKEFRPFFKRLRIDVDKWVISLSEGEHSAIHSGGAEGGWNPLWKKWIDTHQDASAEEVWDFARYMLKKFKLEHHPPVEGGYTRSRR